MKYELWTSGKKIADRKRLFVRSDHNGDRLRKKLSKTAKKTWTVEAESHYHAMVAYWEHLGLGEFNTPDDHIFPGEEL